MNINEDERFAHILKDPRFKRIPKFEKKIKIDKRFQSIFSDKRFQVKYTVDKRGRPINQSSSENFRKYYALSSENESESSESDENAETSDNSCLKKETEDASENGRESKQIQISKVRDNKKTKSKLKIHEKNKIKLAEKRKSKSNINNKLNTSWVVTESAKIENLDNKTVNASSNVLEASSEDTDEENESTAENSSDEESIKKSISDEETYQKTENIAEGSVDVDIIEHDNLHRSRMTDEVKIKLRDTKVDYARGMGTLMTDSSSDEETSDEESDSEQIEHAWGELDADAEETDEATSRIAILHMDWDRIRAADLMVLCNSFLPSDGLVKSVAIYPSEFGLQRLKEEELKGPIELVETVEENVELDENADDEEAKEGNQYHMERLRQYQLNRLKYYYAVVEFDSPETANKVYAECDGLEYESSSTKLDLRFVPDDETFEHEPREMITSLPDPAKYKPRYFTNSALQQGKVQLTWDETDPNRKEFTQKILTNADKATDEDLQAYLAYSSGEEEENNGKDEENKDRDAEESSDEDKGEDEKIARYRALIANIESAEEKKKEQDVEMEITWGVGLKEKAQQLVDEKLKAPQTPFEALLEKKRQKKKMKREEKLKNKNKDKNEDSDDNPYSDDDIPSDIDLNDPYFKEELDRMPKEKKKNNKQEAEQENEEEKRKRAELELLLMDDEEEEIGKRHFSLKGIIDEENESKKKKRRKQLKKKKKIQDMAVEKEDTFQVDVGDERFSALYSSHHFNIDPADPHFHKTKAMEAIIAEKLKRRKRKDSEEEVPVTERRNKAAKLNTEIGLLVTSVKNKIQRNMDKHSINS